MKELLVAEICERLAANSARMREEFRRSVEQVGVRYCVLDDLLGEQTARSIYEAFPAPESMRLLASFREKKYTSKSFDKYPAVLGDITFALQDPRVIALVEQITGISEQIPDATLYAGGLSSMGQGHFLGPHIDNSHESSRKYYRTLNLLYYVTPQWKLECGGNLELWDRDVRRNQTIVSQFNRLVLMETNPWSWHSVSEVVVPRVRSCVSNYYFSPRSPTGREYFNVTSFSARPEQKARRLLAWVDNKLRQAVRAAAPGGLGKKDVYEGPGK